MRVSGKTEKKIELSNIFKLTQRSSLIPYTNTNLIEQAKVPRFFRSFLIFVFAQRLNLSNVLPFNDLYLRTSFYDSMYNVYRSSTFVSNNNERVVYISVSVCVE